MAKEKFGRSAKRDPERARLRTLARAAAEGTPPKVALATHANPNT